MKKPSLTELIGLLDKPALLNWANKQGLKGIDISKERQKWLNDGTSIHSQIEKYIRNKTPFLNNQDQLCFNKFIENKQIIHSEKDIETEFFIGRLDIIYSDVNGTTLADFKRNQKGLYFENKLQLVGYNMSEKCDNMAIISAPDFNVIPVIINNKSYYEEILESLSKIYYLKKHIENEGNFNG